MQLQLSCDAAEAAMDRIGTLAAIVDATVAHARVTRLTYLPVACNDCVCAGACARVWAVVLVLLLLLMTLPPFIAVVAVLLSTASVFCSWGASSILYAISYRAMLLFAAYCIAVVGCCAFVCGVFAQLDQYKKMLLTLVLLLLLICWVRMPVVGVGDA